MNTGHAAAIRARYMRATRVAAVCAGLVLPSGGQTLTIRTNVNLVLLDAAVLGPDDKPVKGLKQENFRIEDAGRSRRVARFETGDAELSVVFTLDFSRSMRRFKPGVIHALQRLRKQLSPADQMAVIVFGDQVKVLPAASASWMESLEQLTPDGRTALYDALVESARLLEQATHSRRVCVLMSDGLDTASRISRDNALNAIRAGNFTTYTIGLFTPGETEADTGFLRKLAAESGGLALFQDRPDRLSDSFDTILSDLRARYLIGFLTDDPREGRIETREVRLKASDDRGKSLVVRTRKTYQIGGSNALP